MRCYYDIVVLAAFVNCRFFVSGSNEEGARRRLTIVMVVMVVVGDESSAPWPSRLTGRSLSHHRGSVFWKRLLATTIDKG